MKNDVLECMKTRRSIRKFKGDAVPKELLDEVIDAGLYAASGMNLQSSIIVEVTNKDLRNKIVKMNQKIGGWEDGFDPFYGAPVILIVLSPKNEKNHVYDGSLVMGNLMLACHAVGLGSCWIHRAKEEFESDEGKAILKELGITGDYEGIGHCAVGYVDGDEPEVIERKAGRVVSY